MAGFPKDRLQNFPPPNDPTGWNGALNCVLDEVPVEIADHALPLRGIRILSPDSVKPGMQDSGRQPNCTLDQEYGVPFTRARIFVAQLRSPRPNNPVPKVNLEIAMTVAGIGSPNWTGLFDPKNNPRYQDWLVQISGLLSTELLIFANIDPTLNPGATELYMTLSVVLDRNDNDSFHAINGPDVT